MANTRGDWWHHEGPGYWAYRRRRAIHNAEVRRVLRFLGYDPKG